MTSFSERPLGPAALDYIRERLGGGKTFAHHLLEALDLEEGSVSAYLPDDVSDESAHQFRYGGKLPTPDESTWKRGSGTMVIPIPNTDDWLASKIALLLSQTPGRVCILEEGVEQASDPGWGKKESLPQFVTIVGAEIYYVIRSADSGETVAAALNWASSVWPGALGALTTAEADDPIHVNCDIDPGQWPVLARRTEALFVGAYDGESYLIWSRRPSASG